MKETLYTDIDTIWLRLGSNACKQIPEILSSLSFNCSPSYITWSIAQLGSKISLNFAQLDTQKQIAKTKKKQLCILKQAMSTAYLHYTTTPETQWKYIGLCSDYIFMISEY